MAGFVTAFWHSMKSQRMWQSELAKRNIGTRLFVRFPGVWYDDQPVSVIPRGALPCNEIWAQWIPPSCGKPSLCKRARAVVCRTRLKLFGYGDVSFLRRPTVALTGRIFIIRMPKGQRVRQKTKSIQHDDDAIERSFDDANRWKRGEAFWHHSWRIRTPWRIGLGAISRRIKGRIKVSKGVTWHCCLCPLPNGEL